MPPSGIPSFRGAIRMFERANETRNVVLTYAETQDKATRHFFGSALRDIRHNSGIGTPGA